MPPRPSCQRAPRGVLSAELSTPQLLGGVTCVGQSPPRHEPKGSRLQRVDPYIDVVFLGRTDVRVQKVSRVIS